MDANLILYVNKLHNLNQRFRGGPLMELPQIVVVGDQSAGKSSLLQNFIGRDFLPAGSDKVTRQPIMLELIHIDADESEQEGPVEYAVFPNENAATRYTDFGEVKQKLHDQMNEVPKKEVIRDTTIVLRIYSPHVVTLTLFDLPGLITNTVSGESKTAPGKILDMVKRHIQPVNVIILAVVAGNTDVATSSAVKLVEQKDPNGDRTVLAVTKLDLVADEDALDKTVDLLMGKTKQHYKEGIVGVINRRQIETSPARTIADVRAEEVKELQRTFQPLATRKGAGNLLLGSEDLQRLLSKLLVRKISESLSTDMRNKIDTRLEQFRADLKMYGDGWAETENVDKGGQAKLAPPFNAFESLMREYIRMTREPCHNAARSVKTELAFTADKCSGAVPGQITRYPFLRRAIVERTLKFLDSILKETVAALDTEINMELEFVNVNHPDFDKGCDSFKPEKKDDNSAITNARNHKHETKQIGDMLAMAKRLKPAMHAYIDIIRRNTLAMVPKVIHFCMVNQVVEKLEDHLQDYFRGQIEDRLFDEPTEIVEKRNDAMGGIQECDEAKSVLDEMRQYCSRREG